MAEETNTGLAPGHVLSRKKAEEEVNKWLDAKRVSTSRREDYKPHIEAITGCLERGELRLGTGNVFTHTLLFPVGEGAAAITELNYKPRVTVATIQHHMQGVKSGDGSARIGATIAALTGQPRAIIEKLDTEDYGIANYIVIFFL